MTLQDLKAEFLARHAVSLDDSAREFVHRFVAFVEAELAAVAAALDAAPSTSGEPEPAVVAVTETKTYPDGTTATGPGPLLEESPTATPEAIAAAPTPEATPGGPALPADAQNPEPAPAPAAETPQA